jgi:hypothetical protein
LPKQIILLMGPSSVGKSTLCKEFKDIEIVSYDGIEEKLQEKWGEALEEKLLKQEKLLEKKEDLGKIMQYAASYSETQIASLPENIKRATNIAKQYVREHPYPNYNTIMNEVYAKAFNTTTEESTIILDVIPDLNNSTNTKQALDDFKKHGDKYRNHNPSFVNSTVFLTCPLNQLSMNIEARAKKNDARPGLLPFQQLAAMTTVENKNGSTISCGNISTLEIEQLVSKHSTATSETIKTTEYKSLGKKFGFSDKELEDVPTSKLLTVRRELSFDHVYSMDKNAKSVAEKLVSDISVASTRSTSPENTSSSATPITLKRDP